VEKIRGKKYMACFTDNGFYEGRYSIINEKQFLQKLVNVALSIIFISLRRFKAITLSRHLMRLFDTFLVIT